MNPIHVLVTASSLAHDAQALLQAAGAVLVFTPDNIDENGLVECVRVHNIHAILLRGSKPITERVLRASPSLRLVAKNGVGVDSVDLEAARALNIEVCIAKGANAHAVAEHAMAMMLALIRDLPALDARVRGGGWADSTHQGRDFRHCVVGVVGYGEIGSRTAQLAQAMGAKAIVHRLSSPTARADTFETVATLKELLARADVVNLCCPLTPQTKNLMNATTFAQMKAGAILINTARGALVDESALLEALQTGHLSGAGLDTLASEPPNPSHPLLKRAEVIFTPHIAGVTKQSALNVATVTANNIVNFFRNA